MNQNKFYSLGDLAPYFASLYALPPCLPPRNFSATLRGFLPSGLESLDFSPDGQLRVELELQML
jgi:hypothetical protein